MKALDSLRIFVITQRKGSLSAAGRSLSLSPATISRRISALEEELGVQLVDRTSRNLKMTEAGQAFLGRAEAVLEAMAEAEEAARSSRERPEGRLRIHSRTQIGQRVIAPLLPKFWERYPDIRVEMELSEHPVNLVEQDFDVDIRTGESNDSGFIIKRLLSSDEVLVASPGFAKTHTRLKHPKDLPQMPCLTYRREHEATTWKYIAEDGDQRELAIEGVLSANNGEVLRLAAIGGMGIALLSEPAVRADLQSGTLVRLLPEYRFAVRQFSNGIFAVFRQSRTLPLKVRAFVDFTTEALREPGT
ncbi:LysR family transcriptional regulator [Ramlibacter ginsenosidimutans]|uniref:LysR family transcriptional regulator n=1 Tax=Ramlibacter ginsenosidimutans TaxID=502333 RepID=A0A934TPD5_9BURK|nr:LysR family transcriptional regulator [Ramlibacter ginsenosidimutans]MBK6005048.1 LysR family transcriptional regulator [Ramlibacter ginsenosidimutans]